MIIYVVFVQIHESVHAEWLEYMQTTHVPDVLKTGCFTQCTIAQVLEPDPPGGSVAYAFQYHCPTRDDYERYQKNYAQTLQADHKQRYGGKFQAQRQPWEVRNLVT